ncbi:hypothetical protein YC2023_061417 [Brassica napus]
MRNLTSIVLASKVARTSKHFSISGILASPFHQDSKSESYKHRPSETKHNNKAQKRFQNKISKTANESHTVLSNEGIIQGTKLNLPFLRATKLQQDRHSVEGSSRFRSTTVRETINFPQHINIPKGTHFRNSSQAGEKI